MEQMKGRDHVECQTQSSMSKWNPRNKNLRTDCYNKHEGPIISILVLLAEWQGTQPSGSCGSMFVQVVEDPISSSFDQSPSRGSVSRPRNSNSQTSICVSPVNFIFHRYARKMVHPRIPFPLCVHASCPPSSMCTSNRKFKMPGLP